jgi:hypothetical protein
MHAKCYQDNLKEREHFEKRGVDRNLCVTDIIKMEFESMDLNEVEISCE